MIITENINVKIINHNLEHYKILGYDVKYGNIINIPVNHLTKGSHYKIKVKCDICNKERTIKYQDYIKSTNNSNYYCQKCVKINKMSNTLLKKYNVDNASKSEVIKKRKELTNIKNWGVKNVFQSEEIKTKIKETLLKKYGVEYINKNKMILEKSKKTRINNGNQIIDNQISDYQKYKKKVLKETRKYINELYNKWDGYDYYDNEIIKNNLLLDNSNDRNYPTIDHKISIFYGFKNNISYKIIGNIDNLCITKKYINSSKNNKTHNDYKLQ